jgi:hypothetical protein
MIIANFDKSGSGKFISHGVTDDGVWTLCGLHVADLRGDWEEIDTDLPGCKKCKSSITKSQQTPLRLNLNKGQAEQIRCGLMPSNVTWIAQDWLTLYNRNAELEAENERLNKGLRETVEEIKNKTKIQLRSWGTCSDELNGEEIIDIFCKHFPELKEKK